MEPIKFDGFQTIIAKDQPEYLNLPIHKDDDSVVTSCWKATWKERLIFLFTGKMFWQQMTFGKFLQPQKPSIKNPLLETK